MFFILSKTLYYLGLPLLWIAAFFIYSYFCKNKKRKILFFKLGLVFLIFFSNRFIINEVISAWEIKPIKFSEVKKYDLGIVLTGVTNSRITPRDRVNFDKGADRVLHTVQLYKSGKIKKILISGGSGLLFGDSISEAEDLAKVFLMCGIPGQDLILEKRSVNTRENALFTKNLLEQKQIKGEYLLITSAFHLRRARQCFNKVGLNPDVFPVDFYSDQRKFTPDVLLLPNEFALSKWTIIIHEIIGMITYKIMGYI
jgi:uncharacterized SAM-binding protein YcdF (DUF218 family)